MAQRLILKTYNTTGVPSNFEISNFEMKKGVNINDVSRLYVSFKVGKRRKLKRLRIKREFIPCELCGHHIYVSGKVGSVEFNTEI